MNHEVNIVNVPFSDLVIDQREIARSLGYQETVPNPAMHKIILKQLHELSSLKSYTFGYRVIEGFVAGNKSIQVGNRLFHPNVIITSCLNRSSSFILLVATVGEEVDHWMREKSQRDDIVEAFAADILGSVIVESIVSYAIHYLENRMAEQRLKITNSYSPGYCGWDIFEQQRFFSLFPENICGISLTPSGLMLPIKSVSSIIGVGEDVSKKEYGCVICYKKNCYKRFSESSQ
ncbi:methionine synthase [Parabacteroides sp. OttesenSCG-928-N08]|nr:methionine synthase [Parabacteroides sp. OttesenSCG-928-N08]